jgi:hypothetical protein
MAVNYEDGILQIPENLNDDDNYVTKHVKTF